MMKCRVTGELVDEEDCCGICEYCDLNEDLRDVKERQVRDECRTEDSGS